MVVKAHDEVAFAHSASPRGAIFLERHNQNAAFNWKIVVAYDSTWQGNVLPREADVAATDFAIANQATGNELRRVDRSGKADSLRRQDHGGVHTNHLSARVDQR